MQLSDGFTSDMDLTSCDVVLILPPGERRRADWAERREDGRGGAPTADLEYYDVYESMGIAYVGAALREAGARVEIMDGTIDRWSREEILERTLAFQPVMVGFSVLWDGYDDIRAMSRQLRARGFSGHITIGQHFATFNHERVLNDTPEIDTVVRFEGEETAIELWQCALNQAPVDAVAGIAYRDVDGCIQTNPDRPLVADLNTLPFPARDVLARNVDQIEWVTLTGSRGCPWRCKFCTITTFYKTPKGKPFRHRSPKNIADEMQSIITRFGKRKFAFTDDQFLGAGLAGRRFARAFADELIQRDLGVEFYLATRADSVSKELFALLQKAGLVDVFLGVESGYQPTLDYYQKDITVETNREAVLILQSLGIGCHLGFIMFHEESTLEEVRANLDFLHSVNEFSWEGPAMFSNELRIFAGTAFMDEGPERPLSPEQSYKKPWEIKDGRTRHYRELVKDVIAPLAVPFVHLAKERGRSNIPPTIITMCAERIRQDTLFAAETLLAAVENNRVSAGLVERISQEVLQTAEKVQNSLEIARLLAAGRLDVSATGASRFI